jgi:hypothetical protein
MNECLVQLILETIAAAAAAAAAGTQEYRVIRKFWVMAKTKNTVE